MTSAPHALIAVIIASALCITGLVAWAWFGGQLDRPATGRHDEFADPADRTDPYGAGFIEDIKRDPDKDWWEQRAPRPALVEVLTGPGTPVRQTSEVTASVLARGTGQFPMLPPEPEPEPEPEPDITLTQVAWVCDLGIPADNDKFVDDLLVKHAAPEMIP